MCVSSLGKPGSKLLGSGTAYAICPHLPHNGTILRLTTVHYSMLSCKPQQKQGYKEENKLNFAAGELQ